MSAADRHRFFWAHAGGLLAMIAAYAILTAYRDFRDNFARELWDALGYSAQPTIMTTAELPVAFGALVAVAAIYFVKNNRAALLGVHAIMLAGAVLVGGSTVLFDLGLISPAAWMISVGLGLYAGYVPFNSVLFDRLIAALGSVATAGFLIYVADAFGYLGSVGLLFYKSFATPSLSWLEFFRLFSYVTSATACVFFVASAIYFYRASSSKESAAEPMR